jgi:hypothetical protein
VVTAVDGIAIKSAAQLRNAIDPTLVGQEVELTYERKSSQTVTRVRIEPGRGQRQGGQGGREACVQSDGQRPRLSLSLRRASRVNRVLLDQRSDQAEQLLMLWPLSRAQEGSNLNVSNMSPRGDVRLVPNENLT